MLTPRDMAGWMRRTDRTLAHLNRHTHPVRVVTKVYTTGTRPEAELAGKGAIIYDDTLGHHISSNGTSWVDGVGTVV